MIYNKYFNLVVVVYFIMWVRKKKLKSIIQIKKQRELHLED